MTPKTNPEDTKKLEAEFASIGDDVVSHLCRQFGVGQRAFVPDDKRAVDPHRAAIRDGEHSVIFHILKLRARGKGENTPVT
jgi:hypothetical protein